MYKKLTHNPKLQGLSRNRILFALGIVGSIILIITFAGTLLNDSDDKKSSTLSSNENTQSIVPDNQATSTLLKKIDDAHVKVAIPQSSPPIVSANESVPPITTIKPRHLKLDTAIDNDLSDLSASNHSLYTSKTLVYSNSKINSAIDSDTLKPQNPTATPPTSTSSNSQSNTSSEDKNPNKKDASNAFNSQYKSLSNDDSNYLPSKLEKAKSPYELKAGSVIPATMINGINSDLPGEIIAQVRQNIYDSATRTHLLIPQGAKLIGLYDSNVKYGQERVLVAWNRLIYQDGSSINLKAMPGTDIEGYAGFHDKVDNKYTKIFGSSFIMGVITGAMQYSQNSTNPNVQTGGLGYVGNSNPTIGQTLSGSLGQQMGQTGLAITQKNLELGPTLKILPNYPFNITTTADMILKPLEQ